AWTEREDRRINEYREEIANLARKIMEIAREEMESISEDNLEEQDFSTFIGTTTFKRMILLALLDRFEIIGSLRATILDDWIASTSISIPCLELFYEFYSEMISRYFQREFASQRGDFIDLEYVTYASTCNSFITQEGQRRFRGVLGRSIVRARIPCETQNLDELLSEFAD
ncbi:unnamed protein product, partial [marine sediment metagenome]